MTDIRHQTAEQTSAALSAALNDRAGVLWRAGHEVSLRHDSDGITMFADGAADSRFWVEADGYTVAVRGESVRQ